MDCETCKKPLGFQYVDADSNGKNAARAMREGVTVRTFMLHGDEGFRFFCSKACATAKRREMFPDSDARQAEIDEAIKQAKDRLNRK